MKTTETIEQCIQARTPVLLWGPPGVGKTATVQHLGKRLNLPVETVIASIHEPSDFNGLPVVHNGSVEFAPPAWAVRLKEAGRGILFLDEISNAPPAVQSALLRVILERTVGNLRLPDEVSIIAAANPPEIATDGWDLKPPLANRLVHLEFKLEADDWVENFPSYWNDPPNIGLDEQVWLQARSLVAAFIHTRPNLLLDLPKAESEMGRAWPSPRSWDATSRLLAVVLQQHKPVEHALPLIKGAVGEGSALEFVTWASNVDLPDPETVLADPSAFKLPARADQQFAVLLAVASAVVNNLNPKRWTAGWQVLQMAAEQGAVDVAIPAAITLSKHNRADLPLPLTQIQKFLPTLKKIGVA